VRGVRNDDLRAREVAAGAVVSPGMLAPRGSVLMGAPARVKRQATPADLDLIYRSAKGYIELSRDYLAARTER